MKDIEKCFRLQYHHLLPWARRQLNRLRPRTDTSRVPFFDNDESTATSDHAETTAVALQRLDGQHSPMQTSSLLRLPGELLLQIMAHLPHSSLYMIHKTCGVFRHLSSRSEFKSFRLEMLRSNEEEYCITKAGFDQLYIVKRLFRRRSLCGPCGELFDSGKLEERLKALWEPALCTRCDVFLHPDLFFPQGQQTENRCVGRLGHFAICKHLKISGKVQEMSFVKTLKRKDEAITCDHPDHISVYDKHDPPVHDTYPGSPRRNIFQPHFRSISTSRGVHFEYFSSFPMMKIHRQQDLDIGKLRPFLFKQLQELDGDGLCQHASGQLESIASSISLGKPRCSFNLWNRCYDYRCPDCSYVCHECGARYLWVWEKDCLILRVWMQMSYDAPDSINWLSNLCFDTDEHPILNSSTENVLWCSNPGCGTGCGERWLLMVEIFKRHTVCGLLHDFELSSRYMTSMDKLPLTLEYQTFKAVAYWPRARRFL